MSAIFPKNINMTVKFNVIKLNKSKWNSDEGEKSKSFKRQNVLVESPRSSKGSRGVSYREYTSDGALVKIFYGLYEAPIDFINKVFNKAVGIAVEVGPFPVPPLPLLSKLLCSLSVSLSVLFWLDTP